MPALIWLATDIGRGRRRGRGCRSRCPTWSRTTARFSAIYVRHVKGFEAADNPPVTAAVDQTFHFLALFALALVVGS